MIKGMNTDEIGRNLLGGLEVALFMPVARQRFGNSKEEAIRSFIVPLLLMPLTIFLLYNFPATPLPDHGASVITALYCMRLFLMWGFFFGIVYWITIETDRNKYFYKFVTASNWLTIPATAIFLPVIWMGISGAYSWAELYPFTVCLILYTYGFSAFMAAYILRIPWELAGFIMFLSMCLNNTTLDLFYWVGGKI